ncbi:hypothetical protein AB1Y20_022693 [Prymnesium parvum]|uniref:Pescadillo homolog n=1 Tax=Prymnesium parvum TaxID=97485 RepID=A0AB34JKC3_PRYPA
MGKNATHREKKDAKRAIKDKKKFKNKNSIGKAKKKTGSAGRYITRTQAVNRLQVTLKDFRRLCILKGIYPREPKKKFKGSNTTYYFAKDILFLSHEPLLQKFREQKAFLKKIRRACGRHEKKLAKRLDARRPVYKLDSLIRERYPTFSDALQDLDDALCLTFLFASLASSKFVPGSRIQNCKRLQREFHSYVARTRSLRKVFISIKGIYYQAEVGGCTLTWVEPHAFAQQPTMSVDYRVMLSFLELYEALLTFVNFKLYHELGLAYPPEIDSARDASGAFLSAMLLKEAEPLAAPSLALPAPRPMAAARLSEAEAASLKRKIEQIDAAAEGGQAEEAAEEAREAEGEEAAATAEEAAMLDEAQSPEVAALRSLFAKCVIFCGRETPVASLELLVLACGGRVGWEGEVSPFGAEDPTITHQVMDRPQIPGTPVASREYVQPQWVFDCINARSLLPPQRYKPGVKCPAHLSPFQDGAEGYVPLERVRQAMMEAAGGGGAEGQVQEGENDDAEEDDEDEDGEEDEEDEEDEENEDEEDDEGEDVEDAREYAKELKAELAGKAYSARKTKPAAQAATKASPAKEEKELAMMMMPRKKRRLYDMMQHGIKKKESAADVLRKKRERIEEEVSKAKGQWRAGKKPPKKPKKA